MEYRKLTKEEISNLEKQGCIADDWSSIEVRDPFDTKNIYQVVFMGKCQLGNLNGPVDNPGGHQNNAGLYSSIIDNSTLEDNVLIRNVKHLKNYYVESGVIIENVDELAVEGEATFGNGTEIDVLNEGGGRELPLYDRLSSQMAYLMVVYRHEKDLINVLKKSVEKYVEKKRSTRGRILSGSRISNCNTIINVLIGPDVSIKGVQLLQNGSVIGEDGTTTKVGAGVIAKDFIIQSGSSVDSGALIDKTFIGQGVKIGKQFSAENSLFFANSEGFHGEAVSIFGGPYTVTHHKSTLMIAGMFSFFNAGSGPTRVIICIN